jgi:hypothetical protein
MYREEAPYVTAAIKAGHKDAEDRPWIRLQFHPEFASFKVIHTSCPCMDYLSARIVQLGQKITTKELVETTVIMKPYNRLSWWGRCIQCGTYYYAIRGRRNV